MLRLAEYKKSARKLSDVLPWAGIVAPGVILNKDGSFQSTRQLEGPDNETATDFDLISARSQVNNALKRLGDGWCMHVESRRIKCEPPKPSRFDCLAAQFIENERCAAHAADAAFKSQIYLTLTYLPPEDVSRKMSSLLIASDPGTAPEPVLSYATYLDAYRKKVRQIDDLLSGVFKSVCPLSNAETLAFLHDAISENTLQPRVPATPFYLDSYLTDTPVSSGLELRLGKKHMRVLSIRMYPDSTVPALLGGLDELGFEFRWVVRHIPMSKKDAEDILLKYRKHWYKKRKGAVTLLVESITKAESALENPESYQKAADAEDAVAELTSDDVSYGNFTLTIVTWADSQSEADNRLDEIRRVVNGQGFVSEVETANSLSAFLGGLPGHAYADTRRAPLSTKNLCDLMPLSSYWTGKTRNEYLDGPTLVEAYTQSTTPFHLNLHYGDVGHTLIVGPTGNGKSTLLNLLAAQWLRYEDAQVFSFDVGASGKVLTHAVGGDFYDLGHETRGPTLQPLRGIDHQDEAVWAHNWIVDLPVHLQSPSLTVEAKDELWNALGVLATYPIQHRTLTTLRALSQHNEIRQCLHPYTIQGPYGSLLDADTERLKQNRWQVFEMERLSKRREELGPVLAYLFHRLELNFSATKPTLLLLDEAWMFLGDTQFSRQIREWLKTLRKKNVAVVFSTQSLSDITDSEISSAIIDSCPTKVFLPNASALGTTASAQYSNLGLNEKQIEFLGTATPKRDYLFHSPEGSRQFQLNLGPVALALCGTKWMQDREITNRLLSEDAGDVFLEKYLRHVGTTNPNLN